MAYNTKPIVTDVDGNPISQYYNPDTDSYEPVEGQAGANKVVLYNADGTENNNLSLIPILDKLSQLTGTVIDEETRKTNELERIDNEDTRKSNELERIDNEGTRKSNEDIRIENENIRIENENIRKANEQNRIDLYNDLMEKVSTGYFNGKNLEFHWNGTSLGVRVEGDSEYIYVDLKGETGDIDNLTSQHIETALGYTPVKSVNNVLADETGNVELDIDMSEIENRIGNVEDDLETHKAKSVHQYEELKYSELSSIATNIDSEGIYKNIEWKRKDNTIYAKSTLIGTYPYPQIKIDYYDEDGTTIVKTITWDLTYDDNDFPYVRTVI